jgi:transposase
MVQKRKTYDPAFKRQAVELTKTRKNVSELARELGIHPQLLYKWRSDYYELGEGSFPGNGNLKLTPEQKKIHELEKKLRDIELEHAILKKAVAIFSKTDR